MNSSARSIQRTYLLLMLLQTLAASLIWGINTLFLLDAGLTNTEAFVANAFFTAGMVVFEVPTGVVADTRGRRMSYLLGTFTLSVSTLLYLLAWQHLGADVGVGDRVGAARARLHVFLRRGRSVARGRADVHRLPAGRRQARGRVRERGDRRRRRDARRVRCRRSHRPGDESRRAVRDPGRRARRHVRLRVSPDARYGLHAPSRQTARRRSAKRVARRARARSGQSTRALGDAGRAVHGRRQHLRVLRDAAVPACSSTATSGRTRSRAWPRRSSPARRLRAG